MNLIQYVVILGALVQLLGVVSYIKETVRGNTKPNRVTWLMWSVAPLIGSIAAFSDGVRWAALPVFTSGFFPLLVFIASFVNPKSYWELKKFDYLCGLCSALALLLWGITKEPIVAILFAIASDGFAATPTLIKSWRRPETETLDVYTASLFSVMTSFLAMKTWSFAEYAFPAYLTILNLCLIFAISRRRFVKTKAV